MEPVAQVFWSLGCKAKDWGSGFRVLGDGGLGLTVSKGFRGFEVSGF